MFVKNVPINLESLPENIIGEYFFGSQLYGKGLFTNYVYKTR